MANFKVTKDFTKQLYDSIKKFKKNVVLVGIPADETERKDEDGINNATLLAINNFGSPANNIPARPVMEIGIRKAQEQIAQEFAKAAKEVLTKGSAAADLYYNRAGMIASNSVKKVINSQEGIRPPSQATLDQRKSEGFMGTKALIRTGQMRNAITYVVRGQN